MAQSSKTQCSLRQRRIREEGSQEGRKIGRYLGLQRREGTLRSGRNELVSCASPEFFRSSDLPVFFSLSPSTAPIWTALRLDERQPARRGRRGRAGGSVGEGTGERACEGVPVGARDLDLDRLSDEPAGAGRVDVDDLAAQGPALDAVSREVSLLALARALDEHPLSRPHQARQVRGAQLVGELEEAREPLALRLLGHVVTEA